MPDPSVAAYFVLMLFYLAVAQGVALCNGFYDRITSPAAQSRYESLDGLRGILALGVFFHHAVVTRAAYITGSWSSPGGFYEILGPDCVSFFFIITGFLFWSKAIHNGAKVDAIKLWKNRLLRIAPMYLFSVLIMLGMAADASRYRLRESPGELVMHVLGCCSLGVGLPDVNGVNLGRFHAFVSWTLKYEWLFYIGLPLLAWFATPKRLLWLCAMSVPLGLMIAPYFSVYDPEKFVFFLLGMVAAQLVAANLLGRYCRSIFWPLVAIALLTAVTAIYGARWNKFALMFVIFMPIAYDSGLFALLRWRATKFLGTISYSVYLLHGIVIYLVFKAVNDVVPLETIKPLAFWCIACCCGLVTIVVSAITYRWVEHPFLSAGGSVGAAVAERLQPPPAIRCETVDAGRMASVNPDPRPVPALASPAVPAKQTGEVSKNSP